MVVWINVATIGAEVISVDIVYKTIVVVVNTRCAVKLRNIDAHVGCKVFVLIIYTTVDDGYHYFAASGLGLPRLKQVDVGAGYRCAQIAVVLIMPLVGKSRVVKHIANARRRLR